MKKFLIIVTLCILCFGCGKNEKNVTINIYQNGETKVEERIVNNDNLPVATDKEIQKEETNTTDTNTSYTLNSAVDKTKDKYNSAKSWYENNKEELTEINREILQENIDTVTNVTDKVKNWYSDNKDTIKDKATDEYNETKNSLKDLFNKIKNNE